MHRYCLAPRDASIRGLRRGGESWFEAVRLQIGEVNARAGGDRFAYARDVVRKNKVNWFDFVVVTDNAEIPSGAGLLRRAAGSEAEIEEEARRTALATFVGLDGSAGDGPNDELRKMPSGL